MWQAGPSCLLSIVWKARNEIAFRNEVLSIQKLKTYLVCLVWLKTRLFIVDGPSTLLAFINWLGCEVRLFFV